METASSTTKIFPTLSSLYCNLSSLAKHLRLRNASTETVFTKANNEHKWMGKQSVSGTGLEIKVTNK
jgi:hypothetical protein